MQFCTNLTRLVDLHKAAPVLPSTSCYPHLYIILSNILLMLCVIFILTIWLLSTHYPIYEPICAHLFLEYKVIKCKPISIRQNLLSECNNLWILPMLNLFYSFEVLSQIGSHLSFYRVCKLRCFHLSLYGK